MRNDRLRIIAAADIYNALATDRPYRKAYSPEKAREMILDMQGKELDPKIVAALLNILETDADTS